RDPVSTQFEPHRSLSIPLQPVNETHKSRKRNKHLPNRRMQVRNRDLFRLPARNSARLDPCLLANVSTRNAGLSNKGCMHRCCPCTAFATLAVPTSQV